MSTPEAESQVLRPYPLYSTTFTLYRLSPLNRGSSSLLENTTLAQHARYLKDLLAGEVLRGVRVGLAAGVDDDLKRAGRLKGCRWKLLGDENAWIAEEQRVQEAGDDTRSEEELTGEDVRGILIEIEYERNTYSAVLLRNLLSPIIEDDIGRTHLPLLLIRMPAALRETFLDHLRSTFDINTSLLQLPSYFLTSSLEKFLDDLTISDMDDSYSEDERNKQTFELIKSTFRDVLFTLSFPAPVAPLLNSLDITIPRDDAPRFFIEGRKLRDQQEPSQNGIKRKRAHPGTVNGPFTRALSQYIGTHLALSLSHPDVAISKIACGAFVIAESKVKIFPPLGSDSDDAVSSSQTATQEFTQVLVRRAEHREVVALGDASAAANA